MGAPDPMRTHTTTTASEQQYARAHAAHYSQHDLLGALRIYGQVIAGYPDTPEAGYSRTQILGIVNQVVPAGDFLAAQTALVLHELQPDGDGPAGGHRP